MVIRLLYIAPYWFIKLLHMAGSDQYSWKKKYDFLRLITVHANRAGRVVIDTHGIENLPEKDGYIMYPNHQGMFDALAIIEGNPHPFSIVMKKEVKDVFFLKQVFQMVGAIPIDREDIRQSMQVILQVAKEVSEGGTSSSSRGDKKQDGEIKCRPSREAASKRHACQSAHRSCGAH